MRGYQKRVIYLKNTGSRNFEEAYFIVRADADGGERSPRLMIEEANRIVEENFGDRRRWGSIGLWRYAFTFVIGLAVGALLLYLLRSVLGVF